MNSDPLAIKNAALPLDHILKKSQPAPRALAIFNRLAANEGRDSTEVRVALLAILVFECYLDLKKDNADE